MKVNTPTFICVFLCTIAAASARHVLQSPPSFPSVAAALTAPSSTNLKTLLSAIKAAGITVPDNAAYTIFAPTDAAFASADIKKKTGLSAAQLLEPKNKDALVAVLNYHIVPSAAVTSSQLKDGQKVSTALKGATPLTVSLDKGVKIKTSASDAGSSVTTPDIKAGKSVIHVVDKVLIPPSLVKN